MLFWILFALLLLFLFFPFGYGYSRYGSVSWAPLLVILVLFALTWFLGLLIIPL